MLQYTNQDILNGITTPKHKPKIEKSIFIFHIFRVDYDENGEPEFNLRTTFGSSRDAITYTKWTSAKTQRKNICYPIHPSMTADNEYIYLGNRGDCTRQRSSVDKVSNFGGYVIEPYYIRLIDRS